MEPHDSISFLPKAGTNKALTHVVEKKKIGTKYKFQTNQIKNGQDIIVN